MVSCLDFIQHYGLSMYYLMFIIRSDFLYQGLEGLQLIVTCLVRETLIRIVKTNEHQCCSRTAF